MFGFVARGTHPKGLILLRLLAALALLPIATSAQSADRYDPANWKPPTFPSAENHLQQEFLTPARSWERIDVWVPKEGAAPFPCVIIFYGGGWGGKVTGGLKELTKSLLDLGYAVAMPDYVLGAEQPVPLAIWDGEAAVRWLRANAQRLKIDPERIGAWGFSAGGWLAQHLAPSDSRTVTELRVRKGPNGHKAAALIPILNPRTDPTAPAVRLQGVITDWGAGVLVQGNRPYLKGWLTPDDPPLLSCHNDASGKWPEGMDLYRKSGAPAKLAVIDVKNTHVPNGKSKVLGGDIQTEDWYGACYAFLDSTVKTPTVSTAPEIHPAGGPIGPDASVFFQSVHGLAAVRYTLDGSEPTPSSATPTGPVRVQPGQTVKAIAIRQGLKPSPVTTCAFTPATQPAPRITSTTQTYKAKVGQPFSLRFTAEGGAVNWSISGKVNLDSEPSNPPRPIVWLTIDAKSGEVTGTPTKAGVCPFVVVASSGSAMAPERWDAMVVVVTVEE